MTRDRKSIAGDLLIELTGGAIIAVITWLATIGSEITALPVWAVITIPAAVIVAVGFLVAYVVRARHVTRMQAELRDAKESNKIAAQNLRMLRDLNRTIGNQLQLGDELTVLKSVTSYTVDADGQDRIESAWIVAYKEEYQGRVFTTEDWSSQPVPGNVTCTGQSDSGTTVLPVLVVDEPTYKQFHLHLHPAVGKTQRKLEVRQTWPDLWKDLRADGQDYVELTARPGLQEAIVRIHIPASLGPFKWNANADAAIELKDDITGSQQTLTFLVIAPQAGMKYRADLVRVEN